MESPREIRPEPVVEELTRWEEFEVQWEEFKVHAADVFDKGIRFLRVPFSIAISTLAMHWLVATVITFAGPAICDFPGTASLDVCKLDPRYLVVHSSHNNNGVNFAHDGVTENYEIGKSGGFDFAAKHAEIQIMTAKSYERDDNAISLLAFSFVRVMANLTANADMWLAMKEPKSQSIQTAHAASWSLSDLKQQVEKSLGLVFFRYHGAQYSLKNVKKRGPDSGSSFAQTLLGVKPTQTVYKEKLSEFHAELSEIQDELLEKAVSTLQKLTGVEDSIESILQVATGNTKPLKREKLSEQRYWAWRLRSLKNKFYVEGPNFNWDANMESCAEFSRSVKEARKLVGSIYLLLLDMKKMLEDLSEELARDMDIWALDDEQQENRVDYYLGILTEGIEILKKVEEKAKELKENMLTERLQIDAKKLEIVGLHAR